MLAANNSLSSSSSSSSLSYRSPQPPIPSSIRPIGPNNYDDHNRNPSGGARRRLVNDVDLPPANKTVAQASEDSDSSFAGDDND